MKCIVYLLFICFASILNLQAQTASRDQASAATVSSADLWKTLMAVEYKNVPDRYYPQPIFSKDLKALAGKRVTLKGFIIPLDEAKKQMNFMLSMVPFSHCFFCGGAGPESVVEVKASTSFDYTAKPVQVSGVLRLNETDENHLFYILEEASPVL